MKRNCFVLSMLMAVFAVVSCSGSNDDKEDMPTITGKQYVFKNDTLIASVSFDNSNYASLQVFNRRSICFSDMRNCTYSGAYPTVEFDSHEMGRYQFSMTCQFASASSFSAIVKDNNLVTIWAYKPFKMPDRMTFNEFNGVLDQNGDGVIDEGVLP